MREGRANRGGTTSGANREQLALMQFTLNKDNVDAMTCKRLMQNRMLALAFGKTEACEERWKASAQTQHLT